MDLPKSRHAARRRRERGINLEAIDVAFRSANVDRTDAAARRLSL